MDVRADLHNGWSDLHVWGWRSLISLRAVSPLCSTASSDRNENPLFSFFLFSCLPNNISLSLSAIAPDFSQNLLKAQTLARQSGDVLIECKPRMSPRGVISWRKGKEALRESHRYQVPLCWAVNAFCVGQQLFSSTALLPECCFIDLLFYFACLIFMVTNCKDQNHSMTQFDLNYITPSALHHSLLLSPFLPLTALYFALLAGFCNVYLR